jgi:hypothetical protein
VYTITTAGRRALRRWVAEPTTPASVRNEMLLKMFFGRQAHAATHRRRIERLRRQAVDDGAKLAELRALLEANASQPDAPYWLMTLRFGEIQSRAHLQWYDEALVLFDALERAERRRARPPAARAVRSASAKNRRRRPS